MKYFTKTVFVGEQGQDVDDVIDKVLIDDNVELFSVTSVGMSVLLTFKRNKPKYNKRKDQHDQLS